MGRHAVLQHGCFYSNGNKYSFEQVSFYIIMRKVCMTALDIQVSLRNPTAMLLDSMTSVKTLYIQSSNSFHPIVQVWWNILLFYENQTLISLARSVLCVQI